MNSKSLKIKRVKAVVQNYPLALLKFFPKIILEASPQPFLLSFPRIITVFATERCNMRCPMCLVQESRQLFDSKQPIITLKNIQPIADQASCYGTAFYFTGGEPLLHKELFAIISYLSGKRLPTGLTTNGYLLAQHAADLVASGLTFLSVSIDGEEQLHDENRGVKGAYGKALEGIKAVQSIKGQTNSVFPIIKLNTTFLPTNLDQLKDIVYLAHRLQVDELSFQHLSFITPKAQQAQKKWAQQHEFGQAFQGMPVTTPPFDKEATSRLEEFIHILPQMERQYRIKISISPQTNNLRRYYDGTWPSAKSRCTVPWSEVSIRANGDIELCHGFIIGNILNNDLKTVWKGQKVQDFRTYIKKHPNAVPCYRCCALKFKF